MKKLFKIFTSDFIDIKDSWEYAAKIEKVGNIDKWILWSDKHPNIFVIRESGKCGILFTNSEHIKDAYRTFEEAATAYIMEHL